MPALQVRDFPEELYEQLRVRAQKEHRSVAQQTIVAVEEHLSGPQFPLITTHRPIEDPDVVAARIARRKKVFERIAATPKFEVSDDFPSAAEIIREARDSR